MKKNVKFFALLLLVLPVVLLAACGKTEVVTTQPTQAVETPALKAAKYLKGLYTLNTENERVTVTKDLSRPLKYTDASVTYTWSLNVGEDKVKLEADEEKGTVAVVVVDKQTETGFDFNLTCTITDGSDTQVLTWYYSVPKFRELSYAE